MDAGRLVAAFALLARALEGEPRLTRWGAAGAAFGLAALTRSSVAYYVPVAAVACFIVRPNGARARCVGALVAAFVLVIAPYVAYISSAAGHFVFIEDIGAFAIKRAYGVSGTDPNITILRYMNDASRGPGGFEILRFLLADFAASPARFVAAHFDLLRLVWKPAGGTLLPSLVAPGHTMAMLWKAGIHLAVDLPFALAAVLWPFGAVLSRRRLTGGLLALWMLELSVMLALTGWAGTRFRAPMEPTLFVLSAVVLAGGWRRPRRRDLAGAAAVAVLPAYLVALSAAATIRPCANYGIGHWPVAAGEQLQFRGEAGFNLNAPERTADLLLDNAQLANEGKPVQIAIEMGGRPADRLILAPGQARTIRYVLTRGGAYVQIRASTVDGRPARISVKLLGT